MLQVQYLGLKFCTISQQRYNNNYRLNKSCIVLKYTFFTVLMQCLILFDKELKEEKTQFEKELAEVREQHTALHKSKKEIEQEYQELEQESVSN